MADLRIAVQTAAFDAGAEIARVSAHPASGAVVSFTGLVRDYGDSREVTALELEHYPCMTETALTRIAAEAAARWNLQAATIIHRVGRLALSEPIVLVIAAASHRRDAFAAAECLMDFLKRDAPFWKREISADGQSRWVEAKAGDAAAAERWR
ncbi:molybdenum cofactor biosynthesis protein MoaE [Xenophilus sp. AP218F]|nr:molybdenum cofactor biosynthesis protein MoaE [Xenophilus sp. AP218F]